MVAAECDQTGSAQNLLGDQLTPSSPDRIGIQIPQDEQIVHAVGKSLAQVDGPFLDRLSCYPQPVDLHIG